MEKEGGAINGQGQGEDGGGQGGGEKEEKDSQCSSVLIAVKSGTRLKVVMRR